MVKVDVEFSIKCGKSSISRIEQEICGLCKYRQHFLYRWLTLYCQHGSRNLRTALRIKFEYKPYNLISYLLT